MPSANKPICFIAMAFGYDDTDEYYEKLVLPVLKQNNITPIIINRHQSNDDLNLQIFGQLKKADFCVADLTYTRPSVYFEAGFAEREIPVIYTVRKDHLDRGQPDDKRVHFDLQMKPLIVWKSPTDKEFSSRLDVRIKKTFLVEWLKKQKVKQEDKEAEINFNSLPSEVRLENLRRQCILEFHKKGYGKKSWNKNYRYFAENDAHFSYPQESVLYGAENYVHGYKVEKNKLKVTSVQSFISPAKNELTKIGNMYSSDYFLSKDVKKIINDRKIKDVHINALILSLNVLSSTRIENALPHIFPIESSKRYYYKEVVNRYNNGVKNIYVDYYFLSGIKSEAQLKDELKNNVLIHL